MRSTGIPRRTLTEFFASRSSSFRVILGISLLLLVTAAKALSGPQIVFSAIYLIPVSFMTWLLSERAGLISACVSALALLLINLAERTYYSHPAIPYWNAAMDFAVFLFAIFALSEMKALYFQERELSREDPLTGVGNRRAFVDALTRETMRARRYMRPLSLVYIDIDDFKQLNDTYGHRVGDTVLALMGAAIEASIRDVDSVARLGGDEFALLLAETDAHASRLVVKKLQSNLQAALESRGWPVSFSMGAATFMTPLGSAEEMIEAADRLMYTVKRAGKNSFAQQVLE